MVVFINFDRTVEFNSLLRFVRKNDIQFFRFDLIV